MRDAAKTRVPMSSAQSWIPRRKLRHSPRHQVGELDRSLQTGPRGDWGIVSGGVPKEPGMDIAISNLRQTDDGFATASAAIRDGELTHTVWYRSAYQDLSGGEEAFVIASLLPAMVQGLPLKSNRPVSPRLLGAIPAIQEIFHVWDEKFRQIELVVPARSTPPGISGDRVGAFFSGGVDSFYTLLKHQEEITDLILVRGFDIRLEDQALWTDTSARMRDVARRFGKRLIEVETNVTEFSDRYVIWDFYYGAGLASVVALLSPRFRKVYIPSGHSYLLIIPNGSHPLVDSLWSTETTEIVHDGCEATRAEKVLRIASNTVVHDHLRVCWKNAGGAYNCGKCEKCLRTMVSLRIAGVLERCTTFPQPLDLGAVARVRTRDAYVRFCAETNLRAAEAAGRDPKLIQALTASLDGLYYRRSRRLMRATRRLPVRLWRFVVPAAWRRYLRRLLEYVQAWGACRLPP